MVVRPLHSLRLAVLTHKMERVELPFIKYSRSTTLYQALSSPPEIQQGQESTGVYILGAETNSNNKPVTSDDEKHHKEQRSRVG